MRSSLFLLLLNTTVTWASAADLPEGIAGFRQGVRPFFEAHCISCHGPEKSKGKMTLHTLDGELSAGHDLGQWEDILEMLEDGEMPPEDEPQPKAADREAVARWIDAGLRDSVKQVGKEITLPTARRLTNFEYQNTMRDLLGIELNLADSLLQDPVKPYKFNNTAELMRTGPEQIDRYLESARRALASVIVDPGVPQVHRARQEWKPGTAGDGLGQDEIAPWGNGRNSPGTGGMSFKDFPKTGEFRIRVKASAILPKGVTEMPLRLVMGYNLNENQSTLQMEPVGTVNLRNNPDHPEIFEFRGRIENYPARPGRAKNGAPQPDTLTITPQNLWDDGTLNDENRFLYWPRRASVPRAVVEWMEFEAPVVDVWPPPCHTRILFDSARGKANPKAYVREILERFVPKAYRRPVTAEELEVYVRIYEIVAPEMKSFEAAVRETLAMVLISPKFLYHADPVEKAAPGQFVLASKLSYFLWGSMPDSELFGLASKGSLDDKEVIARQVLRMLADDRSKDFLTNFTTQWLDLEKMRTVPINKDIFPRFLLYVPAGERAGTEEPYRPTIRDYMIDETIAFVGEVIRRNAGVLDLVDAGYACLNEPLAAHYGVKGVRGIDLGPVNLTPGDKLGGLLTQGSVLIGNGTGSAPHPIYRAVWLREAILGDEVAPPPADVPALSDTAGDSAEQALTIKDLLAQHRKKESCNDCHSRLDPWGIPFEQYNAIGRFQPLVPREGARIRGFSTEQDKDADGYMAYLASVNTERIEASSRLPHGPAVDGMEQLKEYLVKDRKKDIAENVLRRLLTYGMGRELTHRDRFEIEAMLSESGGNGHKMRDMIVTICQSGLFRKSN